MSRSPARSSGSGSCGEERKSATADDAAGGGTDYFAGLRADDGRCFTISAWEAGGELLGTDSAGIQFGTTSAVRVDQPAREPVPADAGGRRRATRTTARSGISQRISA